MAVPTERTTFSLDVIGRYTANTWQEAVDSADVTKNPHARPFDLIVLGGGTFGCALAARLFSRDKTHAHRILVLEAGPVALPEHVQNLPALGTNELWGVPWNSDSPKTWNRQFPGLAYCLGGRSVFWGGWSPHFLPSELPSPPWPADVVHDLMDPVLTIGGVQKSYLDHAAEQIGAASSNDFVFGPLHEAVRDRLFDGLRARPAGATRLVGHRGTPMDAPGPAKKLKGELEAPLAVESTSPRPGFLPFNKFSTVPLMVRTARLAQEQSHGDDIRKRLMLVGNTHVIRLERTGRRITRVVTNQGSIDVPPNGQVFLALGTIENTRLALTTLPNANGLIGRNLMAHLRSNLTFRVPRAAFGAALDPAANPAARELQVSALFVKGVHDFGGGELGHFHLQITASGVGETGRDSEAELFKKVPDIDLLDRFRGLTDEWVVVTVRGIGEMTPDHHGTGANRVTLGGPTGAYDYGEPRALVSLEAGPAGSRNVRLWQAMDDAADEVARIFAGGGPIEYLSDTSPAAVWQSTPPGTDQRRDKLSSTHHEAGTLWMGTDPAASVTDPNGRFHESDNLYAVGPCVLPTIGSPNPVLSGIALSRRTAERALPAPALVGPEPGFTSIFDGTDATFRKWAAVGGASFVLVDGMIVAQPGRELGLLYYTAKQFADFVLRVDFRLHTGQENSGVHVRFRNPMRRVPDPNDPTKSYIYANKAWVAVTTGFEVQIDEFARGNPAAGVPDGLDQHRTGAVYGVPVGPGLDQQVYNRPALLPNLDWNTLEVRVDGGRYEVRVNGTLTSVFTNDDKDRGVPPPVDPDGGFVGLQAHTGLVAFRRVRVKPI